MTVLKNGAAKLKLINLIIESALSFHKRREHEVLLRAERDTTSKSFLSLSATKCRNGAWHFQYLKAQGFDPNDLTSTVGVLLSSENSSAEVLLTAPQSAALHGDIDTISYLISRDADFRKTTICGKSSAYLASLRGHLGVLQLIVEVAGDSAVQMPEDLDYSPLVAAVSNQHVETARWLFLKGSKVQYEYSEVLRKIFCFLLQAEANRQRKHTNWSSGFSPSAISQTR